MEKPQPIRVMVPADEYGAVYEGQWVERAIRVGRDEYKELRKVWDSATSWLRDDKLLEKLGIVVSRVFTDWNLEGNDGPLPKPWGDPKAFEALAASDVNLAMWVVGRIMKSITELAEPPKKSSGGGDGLPDGPEDSPSAGMVSGPAGEAH